MFNFPNTWQGLELSLINPNLAAMLPEEYIMCDTGPTCQVFLFTVFIWKAKQKSATYFLNACNS